MQRSGTGVEIRISVRHAHVEEFNSGVDTAADKEPFAAYWLDVIYRAVIHGIDEGRYVRFW